MKTLYVAWQDPIEKNWLPVGQLTFIDGFYHFVYTKGAFKSKNFLSFGRMNDLKAVYESTELFPLFSNRLLSKNRPEYKDFLHWLKIRNNEDDPLALLALTEGKRETDSLEVFPCPEKSAEGKYSMRFFVHGIRYLSDHAVQMIGNLQAGERLLLIPDPQNPNDRYAIAIRNVETTIVGYCPRYLTNDFHFLLKECDPKDIIIQVEQVNIDAPIQLRLFCQISAPWPENFMPCSSENYQPAIEIENQV